MSSPLRPQDEMIGQLLHDVPGDGVGNSDRRRGRIEFMSLEHDQAPFCVQLSVSLTGYREFESFVGAQR